MTAMQYASRIVKPDRKAKFIGYDLRFQKVKSMNPIAPNIDTHNIQGFP